jgi:hypothetical protein
MPPSVWAVNNAGRYFVMGIILEGTKVFDMKDPWD